MTKTKNLIIISLLALWLGIFGSFTHAAKLYLSPSTGTFTYNCPFDVDVMLDMEWKNTTAMDLKMILDESRYAIMDFNGQGGMFKTYTKPKYVQTRRWQYKWINTVYVFLSTFAPPQGVVGWGKLGTLTIKPNPWVWEMPLSFYFVPWDKGEDSNIPELSGTDLVDGLTQVENGFYKLQEWPCNYHGAASGFMVQNGWTFDLIKNDAVVEGEVITPTTNFIKQYWWYLILLLVIIALIWVRKGKPKNKKS
jgi:hypothetical protein